MDYEHSNYNEYEKFYFHFAESNDITNRIWSECQQTQLFAGILLEPYLFVYSDRVMPI